MTLARFPFALVRVLVLSAIALTSIGWSADPPLPPIPPPPAPAINTPKPVYNAPDLPPLEGPNDGKGVKQPSQQTTPITPPAPAVPAASTPIASDPWQGEYTGRVMVNGALEWFGMQLVSQGNRAATLVVYTGGLPGNLWNEKDREVLESKAAAGKPLAFRWGDREVIVGDDAELRVMQRGVQTGRLVQVIRKSRSLGATPPDGAIVLFDGSSADAFSPGVMSEQKLLQQGAISKQTFGSFRLHLEFQTPFMPEARGQGRGNSGVYLQGRYELQVLDSFGLQSQDNDCGGIYKVAQPRLNMCFPPLSWQTYDIVFQAARFDPNGKKLHDAIVTVEHNGVVIHDRLSIPKETGGEKLAEGPTGGPLYLQDHGNAVRYRNIWLVETEPAQPEKVAKPEIKTPQPPKPEAPKPEPKKPTPVKPKKPNAKPVDPKAAPPQTTANSDGSAKPADVLPLLRAPDGKGWEPLFDGTTLSGWHTNRGKIGHGTGGHWFVKDGTIVGEQDPPGSGNGGILLTDRQFGDFELSLELRPDWGVDSGLFLRSTEQGACLQVMVDYHNAGNVGHIYGEGTGGFNNRTFQLIGQDEKSRSGGASRVKNLSTKPVDTPSAAGFSISGDDWLKVWRTNDWNTLRVRVEGNPARMTTWINDAKVSEFDGESFDARSYDRRAVQKVLGETGRIALQVHGGKDWPAGASIRWRNLWVRAVEPKAPASAPAVQKPTKPSSLTEPDKPIEPIKPNKPSKSKKERPASKTGKNAK